MPRPQAGEYGSYYQRYIDYTTCDDVVDELQNSSASLQNFLNSIPQDKASYAYAPGKWTIKQLLQHLIDAERVFAYRAMCFARGEKQSLPGFDENEFADNATAADRSLDGLISELLLMRQSTLLLFRHLNSDALMTKGIASDQPITPNSIGFIMVGHVLHHRKIIQERYLP